MKKNKNVLFRITFLIVILLFLFIGYQLYNSFYSQINDNKVKVIDIIEGYQYKLKDNNSKLYISYFKKLDKLLEDENYNEEEYVKLISSMFIIDFFTLQNKNSKNDIGGTDFIHEDIRDNFIEQSRSTFYKYININKVDSNLPIVKEITNINVINKHFKYEKINDMNAYSVNIDWIYEAENDYQNSANLTLVHKDNKIYIIEMNKK